MWGFGQDHKKLSCTAGKYEKNYIGILTSKSMSHEQHLHNEELHDLYSLPNVRKFKNKVKTMLICKLYSDCDIYMAPV
jgi:hypothetical protein